MAQNATAGSIFTLEMSATFFASVNVPLSVVSIATNIYLVFCMIYPEQGSERIKQPLCVLLGTLVGFSTAQHVLSLLWAFRDFMFSSLSVSNAMFTDAVLYLVLFSVRSSVTSSLWLNVYYCSQIVPAQHCVFVWLKKNIKVFIYSALIIDKTYNLAGFMINISNTVVFFTDYLKYIATVNATSFIPSNESMTLSYMVVINFWIRLVFNLLTLCAMSVASCTTVLYLWKHIKSMKETDSVFSSPHLQKQMRVTITGIIQALLYFFCSTWMTLDALLRVELPIDFDMDRRILCTVMSFYSFGTTINVCVGQSMFRQRIHNLWKNVSKYLSCHVKE